MEKCSGSTYWGVGPHGGLGFPADSRRSSLDPFHSLFPFFLKKQETSYAVMRTRNTTTRATPSELRDYAVTLHTQVHACTHTRARLHARTHTHTHVARNCVIA